MAEPGPVWLHHGLTSSDLVDTANAYRFHLATEELVLLAHRLTGEIDYLITRHDGLVRVGRTHGQQAEPVLFSDQLNRWRAALARARDAVTRESPPMKLSGAVGSYAYNSRAVEGTVARRLGLRADTSASQVVARDHYSSWAFGVVALANVCERIATEIRLGAQSEIAEFSERFNEGRVGSTAMPHKRNPVRSERICGLARVARGFLVPILETDAGLWGERDISNSSVERIALRNLVVLVGWMLTETQGILFDLEVHDQQMARHLANLPLPTPAAQLYVAAQFGHPREYAHRMISGGQAEQLVLDEAYQAALDRWTDPGLYR
jgi:adenylosuccinate lyase